MRTPLHTAFTRARRLVVLVGQRKALGLAVGDWRRAPQSTALGGILTKAPTFAWPSRMQTGQGTPEADDGRWEGLTDGGATA